MPLQLIFLQVHRHNLFCVANTEDEGVGIFAGDTTLVIETYLRYKKVESLLDATQEYRRVVKADSAKAKMKNMLQYGKLYSLYFWKNAMIVSSKLWKRCLLFLKFALALLALLPGESRAQATSEQTQTITRMLEDALKAPDPIEGTQLFQKAVNAALAVNDKYLAATVQFDWGISLSGHGRIHDALPYAQSALMLYEELKLDNDCCQVEGLFFDSYWSLGNYKDALAHGQECLQYARKAKVSRERFAVILRILGQAEGAIQLTNGPDPTPYEKYRRIALDVGANTEAAILQTDIAFCAKNAGNLREARNLYENALNDLLSDPEPYSQMLAAKTMIDIGLIYLNWGLCEEAIPWYDRAIDLASKPVWAGDRRAELALLLALMGKGTAYNTLERYDKARAEWEKALSWANKPGMASWPEVVSAVASIKMGLAAIPQNGMERRPDPLVLLRHAENTLRHKPLSESDLPDVAAKLTLAGWLFYYQDQFPQALKALQRSLYIVRKADSFVSPANYPAHSIVVLTGLGIVETELKHEAKAEEYLKEAISQQQVVYSDISFPQQQASQEPLFAAAYRAMARLRIRQGRPEEALVWLEQGRAQSVWAQYRRLTASVGLKDSDHANFLEASQALFETRTPTPAAMRKYHEEEAKLRKSGDLPDFSPLLLARNDIALLTQRHPDTLFLEWSLLDNRTVLLIAFGSKDKIRSLEWRVPSNSLQVKQSDDPKGTETAARWLNAVTAKYDNEPQLALQLYGLLFGRLETKTQMLQPGRYRRLALVTDGEMVNLPFAALRDTKGNRLLDRYIVSVHFALKLLARPLTFPSPDASALIVADPRPETQPLLVAHDYAQRVAIMLPRSRLLAGKEATQAATLAAIKKPTLLVFATHGWLTGSYPSLLLADDPRAKDNGCLEPWQVALTPLHARLAVLWGCGTGLGKPVGAEGLLGFVWAFHAAGCPAVVCSQWDVEEKPASELMEEFHKQLSQGRSADEALTLAMKLTRQKHKDPKDWAPFQIYGSAQPLFPARPDRITLKTGNKPALN